MKEVSGSKFTLADDDGEGGGGEQLTHMGRSLAELEDIDEVRFEQYKCTVRVRSHLLAWRPSAGAIATATATASRLAPAMHAKMCVDHAPLPLQLASKQKTCQTAMPGGPAAATPLQGWGSDDDGDGGLGDELVRDHHFGGGLFERKEGGGEAEEDAEGRAPKKTKKEVSAASLGPATHDTLMWLKRA
jgi:hypothetical protein